MRTDYAGKTYFWKEYRPNSHDITVPNGWEEKILAYGKVAIAKEMSEAGFQPVGELEIRKGLNVEYGHYVLAMMQQAESKKR